LTGYHSKTPAGSYQPGFFYARKWQLPGAELKGAVVHTSATGKYLKKAACVLFLVAWKLADA